MNPLKIEHHSKQLTLADCVKGPEYTSIAMKEGITRINLALSVTELATLRNHCTERLNKVRADKRTRESQSGQGEVNLDR